MSHESRNSPTSMPTAALTPTSFRKPTRRDSPLHEPTRLGVHRHAYPPNLRGRGRARHRDAPVSSSLQCPGSARCVPEETLSATNGTTLVPHTPRNRMAPRAALDVALGVGQPANSDEEFEEYHPHAPSRETSNGHLTRDGVLHDSGPRTITWRGVLAHLGPAFLVSVGYLDPGNWATDIEGGSRFGYQLLWVLIMANFMALLLQTLAARMGIVSQSHLAELCRDEYPRPVTVTLWVLAELAIVATDLTEVLGTAIGLNLLFGIPLMVGVVITALDTFLLLAAQSQGMRRIEQIMFVFLTIISLCFIAELFMSTPSASGILKGIFIPSLNNESLYVAIGIIGATVMPHNFYLHSALVTERVTDRDPETLQAECTYTLIDTAVALNAALFINAAILIIAAADFWTKNVEVTTLAKAYHLLENTGFKIGTVELAPLLFGIALIASGQSSTLCGTLAGQYVMEGFLDMKAPPIVRRLITRLVAIVPAMIVISASGDSGTYQLLIMSQVVLSLQLPFAVVPMIRFTASKKRMKSFANSKTVSFFAWLSAAITIGLNVTLVIHSITNGARSPNTLTKIFSLAFALPIFIVLMMLLLWIAVRKETGSYMTEYRLENDHGLLLEDAESDDDYIPSMPENGRGQQGVEDDDEAILHVARTSSSGLSFGGRPRITKT